MAEHFIYIVFVILSFTVIFPKIPLKYSFLAFLTLFHFNLSGSDLANMSTLGLENSFKLIVLPTVLLFRTHFYGLQIVKRYLAFKIWICFCLYIVVASTWSSLPISALKMVGYLYSFTITVLVFIWLYKMEKHVDRIILVSAIIAIILAIFRTYVFRYSFQYEVRFAAFSGMNDFGLYLALMIGILLLFFSSNRKKELFKSFVILFIVVSIYFNGSRTGMLLALIFLSFYGSWQFFLGSYLNRAIIYVGLSTVSLVILLFLNFYIIEYSFNALRENRLYEGLQSIYDKNVSVRDIGTFQIRLKIYNSILQDIKEGSIISLIFGQGTSEGGKYLIEEAGISYRNQRTSAFTPNRLVHNGFLRILYEWGLWGELLFLAFFLLLVVSVVRNFVYNINLISLLLVGLIISLLIVINISNVFTAIGGSLGSAISLSIARISLLNTNERSG